MTNYEEFCQAALWNDCENCGTTTYVKFYGRSSASPLAYLGPSMRLCYVCASTHGANAQEYPQQHPFHDSVVKPILGAISLLLLELKPKKGPRKPKQPRAKLSVMPMAPKPARKQ
jgi:hypothetical protein